jgi:hypothetical protein
MRWASVLLLLCPLFAAAQSPAAKPRSAITVWDTGQPSAQALASAALTDTQTWTTIAAPQKAEMFRGDAVLTNGKVLAVLRQRGSTAEVYAVGAKGAVARLRLQLLAADGTPAERLERLALVENTRGAACVEADYQTAKGATISARFRLKRGDIAVQVEPAAGAGRLRVECPSRLIVLPDFFADDILIDAHTLSPDTVELPSENFVLHLAGDGEAIAVPVFENRQHDVKVHLQGTGAQRTVTASEIEFEGKKIWVALLEGPQVWHRRNLQADDTGKIVPLDWHMPFPAQWRVDFTRPNGLTDSWEMLLPLEGGQYVKPSWLGSEPDHLDAKRGRWNTVLGWYPYPCWSDHEGRAYLQPLKSEALQFQGPVVIYPINRVEQTPLDAYTVVDIMRNTLGVGPCQYILDLEGQKAEYRGRATCSVRDELGKIYSRHQQKEQRAEVERILDQGLTFVTHIRSRITRYVEFEHKMHDYLAAQKKAHPELAEVLNELDALVGQIDARLAARADKIQTPAYVAAMNEEFRKNVLDDTGPDALAKCRKYTAALVTIGDNQDELSGECRWVVKALRQKAGLLLAQDPRLASVATEIRARTQEALRSPANHEGAHH